MCVDWSSTTRFWVALFLHIGRQVESQLKHLGDLSRVFLPEHSVRLETSGSDVMISGDQNAACVNGGPKNVLHACVEHFLLMLNLSHKKKEIGVGLS